MLFPIYQKQQYKIKKAYTISCFRWRRIQVIYNYDPDKRRAQSSDEAAFFKTKFFFCAQKNRPWRVPVTQWTHDPYMFFLCGAAVLQLTFIRLLAMLHLESYCTIILFPNPYGPYPFQLVPLYCAGQNVKRRFQDNYKIQSES